MNLLTEAKCPSKSTKAQTIFGPQFLVVDIFCND